MIRITVEKVMGDHRVLLRLDRDGVKQDTYLLARAGESVEIIPSVKRSSYSMQYLNRHQVALLAKGVPRRD